MKPGHKALLAGLASLLALTLLITYQQQLLRFFKPAPAAAPAGEAPADPDPPEEESIWQKVTVEARLLEAGTDRETPLYIITAPEEGPTVMVIGGVHGDEPAGYEAAQVVSTWLVDRGTLLVLPRANALAVATGTRYPEGTLNLNRIFPGNAAGSPTERLAASIFAVMAEYRPLWVVDLHEARVFEHLQFDALGQTIIYPEDGEQIELIEWIIAGMNSSITEKLHQFQVKRGGVAGGTIYASRLLQLESFTVETTQELPLQDRINQHLDAVRLLLSSLGVTVNEGGLE